MAWLGVVIELAIDIRVGSSFMNHCVCGIFLLYQKYIKAFETSLYERARALERESHEIICRQ